MQTRNRIRTWLGRLSHARSATTPRTPIRDIVAELLGKYGTTVLNVGARWGDNSAWWRIDPVASLIGFEPDSTECERLNTLAGSSRTERYLPLALGATKSEGVLYRTQEPACASVYPPIEDLARRFPQLAVIRKQGAQTISLTPLDDWWEKEDRPHVSFLKLDTQGSELDILKGAPHLLSQALGIEAEVEFSPIYQGQPLFSDLDAFMRANGFHLWGLRDLCHYSEHPKEGEAGRLYWANAVYFRDYRLLGNTDTDWRNAMFLAVLLEAYGDHAAAQSCLTGALQALSVSTAKPAARLEWTDSLA